MFSFSVMDAQNSRKAASLDFAEYLKNADGESFLKGFDVLPTNLYDIPTTAGQVIVLVQKN